MNLTPMQEMKKTLKTEQILTDIEINFSHAKSMYESGEISPEEYSNLLKGFEVENVVTVNADQLQRKEEINKLVTAAISAASLLG